MAENWGSDIGITEQVIAHVDKCILSPQQRVELVYHQIQSDVNITKWDIICFCLGYLASVVPLFPMFGPAVKNLGQMSFLIHYLHPEEIDESYTKLTQDAKVDERNNMAGKSNEN